MLQSLASLNKETMDPKLTLILHKHFTSYFCERYFQATGLTSAKGNSLNGRVCSVCDYDFKRQRLCCQFSGEKTIFKIKGENLMSVKGLREVADWQQRFPANTSLGNVDQVTEAVTGENFLETLNTIRLKTHLIYVDFSF